MDAKGSMSDQARIATRLLAGWMLAALVACGGGGGGYSGGGGGGGPPGGPPANPAYTAGMYAAPDTYAAYCAAPRSGIDPVSGVAYPDKLGSSVWENFWLRSWTNAFYLWYQDVPDVNPSTDTTPNYFKLMKSPLTTATGHQKDRFHFTYGTSAWEALSQNGQNIGYGITWDLIAVSPPRQLVAALVQPGTPASGANIARGATVLKIDGVDVVNAADSASVATINAGISPSTAGESHTFIIEDTPGGAQRSVTLVAANITENPVPQVLTFTEPDGGIVGYIEFDDHVATSEAQLVAAFQQLATAHATDLVLDIRYNTGGYLDIASEVAYMIAGPGPTANKTFDLTTFSNKYPSTDPITGRPLTPTPFHATTQGFSTTSGQPLPSLGLTRLFVLTTDNTCSASEAIINGLRGVNISVIQVGSTTCGKPYGFYPQDNCGTTYFSIEFQGINNASFGDYPDGFTPNNSPTAASVSLPGCSVADDFTHRLGERAEAQLAAALGYRTSTTCPVASGNSAPRAPTAAYELRIKPEPLLNRIMRRP